MDNKVLKGIMIALLAVYVISPLDLAPGPLDDLLLILFSYVMNNKFGSTTATGETPDQIEGSWRDISNQ